MYNSRDGKIHPSLPKANSLATSRLPGYTITEQQVCLKTLAICWHASVEFYGIIIPSRGNSLDYAAGRQEGVNEIPGPKRALPT